MIKDTPPSYQNQLNYIKSLWSEVKDTYSTESKMPSMLHKWDFNKMEELNELGKL